MTEPTTTNTGTSRQKRERVPCGNCGVVSAVSFTQEDSEMPLTGIKWATEDECGVCGSEFSDQHGSSLPGERR